MSSARMLAATPSPPPTVHMPPTPRLGYGDNWEPYSPRKSARLAQKSASSSTSSPSARARTPSPAAATRRALRSPRQTNNNNNNTHNTHNMHNMHSNADSYKFNQQHTLSPAPTPRKKRTMPDAADSLHHLHSGNAFLSPEDAVRARKKAAAAAASTASAAAMGALPTPAKTPSKKTHAASQNASNIAAIARNLFHTDHATHSATFAQDAAAAFDGPSVDDVMASPSRGRRARAAAGTTTTTTTTTTPRRTRKYTGLTLESFTAVEEEEPIAIFTDSQDRVPEVDADPENPFYDGGGEAAAAATAVPKAAVHVPETPRRAPAAVTRRRSKRTTSNNNNNMVSIPGEGRQQTVAEASRREDGLVYVFRGKKIFRKFDDSALAAQQDEDVLEGRVPGRGSNGSSRRLTRSAIQPRLLFPQELRGEGPMMLGGGGGGGGGGSATDDEEAPTDIEDHNMEEDEEAETEVEEDEAEDEAEAEGEDEVEEQTKEQTKDGPTTPPRASSRYAGPSSPPATVTRAQTSSSSLATTAAGARTKRRSPFDGWRQTKRTATTTTTTTTGKRQRPAEEEEETAAAAASSSSSSMAAAANGASSKRSRM